VLDANGSVSGAIVQVQGTPYQQVSAADGTFTFKGLRGRLPVVLTAWAEGYFIGFSNYEAGKALTITLKPLFDKDNLNYDWFEFEGVQGSASWAVPPRVRERRRTPIQAAVNRALSPSTAARM
jgi:hypothetical protein